MVKMSIFWKVFENVRESIWEGPGASKMQFFRRRRKRKTPHYMVRSTLLHLWILAGPSGWSDPFEFSCDLCIKSWNLVISGSKKTGFLQSTWKRKLHWSFLNFISLNPPNICAGYQIRLLALVCRFFEKFLKPWKNESVKAPAPQNINFAAAGAKENQFH